MFPFGLISHTKLLAVLILSACSMHYAKHFWARIFLPDRIMACFALSLKTVVIWESSYVL